MIWLHLEEKAFLEGGVYVRDTLITVDLSLLQAAIPRRVGPLSETLGCIRVPVKEQ
jgi:hypothetical protein